MRCRFHLEIHTFLQAGLSQAAHWILLKSHATLSDYSNHLLQIWRQRRTPYRISDLKFRIQQDGIALNLAR